MKRFVLLYQAGIANVFEVDHCAAAPAERNARRHFQGTFWEAEAFARGAKAAGAFVVSMASNRVGDVADKRWDTPLDSAPFRDRMNPVWSQL